MVRLADGREVTPDLSLITIREYRAIFNPKQPQADEDATLAKVFGISVDELNDQNVPTFKRLFAAFLEAAKQPVEDDPKN